MLDFVTVDEIECGLPASSKRQVLETLSKRAAKLTGLKAENIFAALLHREKLGSTGLGDGIAIPHARIESLNRLFGIFARLDRPIDFEAVDDQPVDIVFLLLAPAETGTHHLNALSKIARALRDKRICQELRRVQSSDAAFNLLQLAEKGNGRVA